MRPSNHRKEDSKVPSMAENPPDHPHEPPDEATSPSTLRITSKPFEEHKQGAVDRAEQWADGEEVPHVVNFKDASRIQRLLTPRRLELIRNLMGDPAESIRDLADRLDRDVRQVHDDLQLLSECRIVHFRKEDGAKKPHVPYETISIEVELSVSVSDPSESGASA
jgi:predicted transcriptional regulator